MTIGERIRAARKEAGLTQGELAEKLGISAQGIAQWENGVRNAKLGTIKKVAEALDVPFRSLIPDSGEERNNIESKNEDAAQSHYYMVSALIFHYTSKYRESKEIITEICEMVGKLLKAEEPCGGGGAGMIRGWLEEILANEEETPDGQD